LGVGRLFFCFFCFAFLFVVLNASYLLGAVLLTSCYLFCLSVELLVLCFVDDTQTIDEIVEGICASDEAFAALKMDGTVMAWGNKGSHSKADAFLSFSSLSLSLSPSLSFFLSFFFLFSSSLPPLLSFSCCVSRKKKLCFINPLLDQGGDCSSVQNQLKRVRAISSTLHAFAAVLHDGTVETWGHPDFGGSIPLSTKERLWQVLSISGSDRAFAALMEDGTVETWGKLGSLLSRRALCINNQ